MDMPLNASPRDQERDRLNKLPDVQASNASRPGVLLGNEIERCCREFSLISPFSRDQLKAASYRLTVGSRYGLGGHRETLGASQTIVVPPFQVVVIETRETLNLPRDMIARWNIKVSRAYQGLFWAGGPQVDPGYQGHLFCPIYNLSNREVALAYADEIAVIDFVSTTAFDKDDESTKRFHRPPGSLVFEDYPTLDSGLSDAWNKIQNIDTKVTVWGAVAITLIGIIIAALSVVVSANPQIKTLKFSEWISLLFSGIALALSCQAWARARSRPGQDGVDVASALVWIVVGIFIVSVS